MLKDLQVIADLARQHIHRGQFALGEGQRVDWYMDGRAFMLSSQGAALAGRCIADLIGDDVRCVGGPATAAIPVVSAVIHQSSVARCGFYVRPEPKVYGLLNRIEGNLEPVVAVVDDTCYSGDSIIQCIQAVEEAGSEVRKVVAVFDREDGGELIRSLGYDYRYLIRLEGGEPILPNS